MAGKVVLDTNVFIDYLRDGTHAEWVAGRVEGTVRFLASVVLLELRLGADTVRRRRAVDRLKLGFPPNRIVTPSAGNHDEAGTIFRTIHGPAKTSSDRLGPMNDLLIALTARQIGATVVTSNVTDFERIARRVDGLVWRRPD